MELAAHHCTFCISNWNEGTTRVPGRIEADPCAVSQAYDGDMCGYEHVDT